MAEPTEDYCERCGEHGPGVRKWMFYRSIVRKPEMWLVHEFFCYSCLKTMKIYAIIGFTLFAIIIGTIIGATIWVNSTY